MKQFLFALLLLLSTTEATNTFLNHQLHDLSTGYSPDTLGWHSVRKKFRVKIPYSSKGPEQDIGAFLKKNIHVHEVKAPQMHSSIYGTNGFFNWYSSSISARYVLQYEIISMNEEKELRTDLYWAPVDLSSSKKDIRFTIKETSQFSFKVQKGDELLEKEYPILLTSGLSVDQFTIKPVKLLLLTRSNKQKTDKLLKEHIAKLKTKYSLAECKQFIESYNKQQITSLYKVKTSDTTQASDRRTTTETASVDASLNSVSTVKKETDFGISFQANIFQALIKDTAALDFNTKVIPAIAEFSIGNEKVEVNVGFGAYRTKRSPSESLAPVIDSLLPLTKRIFKGHFGIVVKAYEKKRFTLRYANIISFFNIKNESITVDTSGEYASYAVSDTSNTNIEFFSGFEPHFHISERFSLFTRSGVSFLWLDTERNKFRIAPRALHGGIGLRFHF